MSEQFKAALLRAVGGAIITFMLTFFATYQATDVDNPRRFEIILMASGAAAVTYVASRGGLEGWYDTNRQKNGELQVADVGVLPPPQTEA